MLIAGFDCCSKSIACVILDSESRTFVNSFFIESKEKDWSARLLELVTILEYFADNDKPKGTYMADVDLRKMVGYIETPIYLQNIKATNSIARVVGVVHSWLIRNLIPDYEVDVKSWKKSVLGNGNASKEEIMKYAKVQWGDKIINQDIADAACIAMWGVLRSGNI